MIKSSQQIIITIISKRPKQQNQLIQLKQKNQTKMKSLQLSFQGSPQKFGKAAYCDLIYTESKLYDNVLFKDLISFRDIWTYKSQVMTLQALYSHVTDFLKVKMEQKQCIIQTQKDQIQFLRRQNYKLAQKNIQRTRRLLKSHQTTIKKLISQKQQQVHVIQGEKQLLQERISQLQKQLQRNSQLVSNIEYERQQTVTKEKRNEQQAIKQETFIKQLETQIQRLQKENRLISAQLNEQNLQLELKLKKQLIEEKQQRKHQIQDLHKMYKQEIQKMHEQKIQSSLQAKQILNKTIDKYEALLNQIKPKNIHLQESVETLQKQVQFEKQRNQSLLNDIKKQDDILDKYEGYLKQADDNLINLKQLLTQSQLQLEQSKHIIEKNLIERQSLYNRIKICQEEATKWRQSYYLNKSRIPDIIEN